MNRALRSHFRDVIAKLLLVSRATEPKRTLRGCLPIITFHRVLPDAERRSYPLPGLVVTPSELEWFLEFFGRDFRCGTLSDSVRQSREEPDAIRPSLAITFDDGQLDNWCYARPVLDQLGVKASFFVPVDSVQNGEPLWHDRIAMGVLRAFARHPSEAARLALEFAPAAPAGKPDPHGMVALAKDFRTDERNRYVERWERLAGDEARPEWDSFMSWDQLRSLSDSGHEIGSHSMSHAILPLCTSEEIAREVGESRRILESRLDTRVESFCYPNGDCDARCVGAVDDSGYRQAVTTAWGANPADAEKHDRFRLRRFDMRTDHSRDARGNLSTERVAWRISGFHPGLG
jgi:peptidoglycan/xylan/chitin deacetylase (PgdA/CDA1 family)